MNLFLYVIQVFETQARYVVTVARSNWLRCLTIVSNSQIEKLNKLMKAELSLKVWCRYPTELWSTVSFDNYYIILLYNIKWLVVYQCKVWCRYPTELWSTVSFDNYYIILLYNIKWLVVYTKALVNFGCVIGQT